MEIVITEWALDSYLALKRERAFTDQQYEKRIRPDVLLLKNYPAETRFNLQQFWSIAECPSGQKIPDGFKMKWDQLGNGRVEMRLPVAILSQAFLCEAYVKGGSKEELRKLARFKTHLQLIRMGKYRERGRLK
jgi:hypothetical protein